MRRTLATLASLLLLGSAHSAHSAPSVVDRPPAVCTYLARAANSGSLERSFLRGHRAHDSAFPVPEDVADWGELTFKDLIDINNDGKAEYVYVVQYPPPRQDDSSTIIESRIIKPFAIPRYGTRQELYVFDQTMEELDLKPAQDEAKELPQDADRYRLLRYGSTYYLVALNGDELRYVQRIDSTNTAQPVCAFEQTASGKRMQTRALTTYRWLKQSFEQLEGYPGTLWLYAFQRADFEVAELLARNGRSVNERIEDDTLLLWAIDENRGDIVDWLLEHGADPSIDQRGDDPPISLAVRHENIPVALKLIEYGADPRPHIDDIAALRRPPEQKRSLLLATIDSVGYVPEEFVLNSLDTDPSSLDGFVASGKPVRPLGISWHAGERMRLPFYVDREIRGKSANSAEVIERLFERQTIPPEGNFAVASYGTYAQGVQVIRYDGSNVSDEDFLSMATALCYYFMPFDCGAEELIVHARAWADAQPVDCPASIRSVVNEQACRVVGYYADSRHDRIHAFSVSEEGSFKKGDAAVQWKQFLDTYRAKHGH